MISLYVIGGLVGFLLLLLIFASLWARHVQDGILVGHSMGGFLSIVFLLSHAAVANERLKGVILFATMAGRVVEGSPQNRWQIRLIRWGWVRCLLLLFPFRVWMGRSLFGNNPSPSGIRLFLELFRAQNHRLLLPILDAMAYEDHYPNLGDITTKCIVICGENDHTTPHWHSEQLAQGIPNAQLTWVEGAGHMLNWEAPQSLIEAIESFQD